MAASFNGGPPFLAQWWTATRDFDVMCPHYATAGSIKAHFRKFLSGPSGPGVTRWRAR